MDVVWDEAKRLRNLATHSFDFVDARERFDWGSALVLPTYPSTLGGERYTATGYLDDELVTLVFAPLGTQALSFISLRFASRKERKRYGQR